MIRFILDTDTLTHLRQGHPKVTSKATACSPGELAVSVISVEEQLSGWYTVLRQAKTPDKLARAYEQMAKTVADLSQLPIVAFGVPAIHRYDALVTQRLGVRKMDLRIAAISLELNCTVVTCNVADFGRVPGLSIVDWSK